MTTLIWIQDYKAKGKRPKPDAKRHRLDCKHFGDIEPWVLVPKELTTEAELQAHDPCPDCLNLEYKEQM